MKGGLCPKDCKNCTFYNYSLVMYIRETNSSTKAGRMYLENTNSSTNSPRNANEIWFTK